MENKGYEVSSSDDPYGLSVEVSAKKDRDIFLIEAIGDGPASGKNIIYALGKLMKRMSQVGFWLHYGVAMPKDYFKQLKDFEVGGIETLKLHFFFVDNFYQLTHLDPAQTIKLITELKKGDIATPDLVAANYT